MSKKPPTNGNDQSKRSAGVVSGLLRRAILLLGCLFAIYCSAVLLVMTPWIQTHVVYAHRIYSYGPVRIGFAHPESYGLAPGKAIDLRLHTTDGTSLGAWFIFSEPFYRSLPFPHEIPDTEHSEYELIKRAVSESPTLLFLHGNTGTRALPLRTALYTALTSRLSVNILALDYRGFGDSTGHPTVPGVTLDARTAWDWLTLEMGAKEEDVVIMGHSLGTAISALLAAQLGKEGVDVRGVALLSPFSSIRLLMDQYSLFGFLPLLKPLSKLPFVPRVLTWSVAQNFDTLSQIPDITAPVLIAHALDDADISHTHADVLFNAMLDPYLLSSVNASTHPVVLLSTDSANLSKLHHGLHADWDALTAAQAERAAHRGKLVTSTEVPYFGVLHEFEAPAATVDEKVARRISLLKTLDGGHDIPRLEGVQDVIGRMFGLIPENNS